MSSFSTQLGLLNPSFNPQQVTIGEKQGDKDNVFLTLDASVNEVHANEAEVTEHPVERGSNITDHVRRQPEVVEIEGVMSNKPLAVLASQRVRGVKGGPISTVDRDAHSEILRWLTDAVVMFISTTLRDYENMVLTSVSVTRNAQNGDILRANMRFREIIFANTELGDAPQPANNNDKGKTQKGRQTNKDARPEVINRTQSSSSHGVLFG